jgi:hypothetical protein
MRNEVRLLGAAVVMGGLGACATPPPASPVATSEPSPLVASAAEVAKAARSLRGSARADVIAALGPATIIQFDSDYEVWVYRFVEPAPTRNTPTPDGAPAGRDQAARDRPPSELVMLFTPSGIVAKVRVRSPAR